MAEFVSIGETMALLTSPEIGRLRDMRSLRLSIAGSESNVAIGMARLGRAASWLGRVGADEFGELVLATLRFEGVDVGGAIADDGAATAIMLKERRTADVVRVSYYRAGYAGSRLEPGDLDEERIRSCRVLHLSGITPGLSRSARSACYAAAEIAAGAGVPVSFDFNYRAALWPPEEAAKDLRELSRRAETVFAGEDEITILDPGSDPLAVARELAGEGPREVVVRRGARGAVAVGGGSVHDQPAFAVQAVDPVGAGDAFVAGYLDALLDGEDVDGRLRRGCAAGAFAVTVVGDWEAAPSRSDLELLTYERGTTLR